MSDNYFHKFKIYFRRDLQKGTETAMEDIVTVESGNDINHSLALTEWLISFLYFLTNLDRRFDQNAVRFPKSIVADPECMNLVQDPGFFLNPDPDPPILFQVIWIGNSKKLKVQQKINSFHTSFYFR